MCSVTPPNDLSDKGHGVEEWRDLRFFRPIGVRIARALYPTGISPDQVTLWSLLIGLVAGHLFVYQDRWIDVIGFVLFIVSDVFDSADGQLARLRGSSTRFGRALDGISDNLRFVNLYFHLIYRLIHAGRSEEHTSELQSRLHLVCRLLLEKKKKKLIKRTTHGLTLHTKYTHVH